MAKAARSQESFLCPPHASITKEPLQSTNRRLLTAFATLHGKIRSHG